MSRKVSTKVTVLVIVLLAAFLGSQALARSSRPVADNARENLLDTIYGSTWFVPNPEFAAVEEAEMARAHQLQPEQAREDLLDTIYGSTWFVPNPNFTTIEEVEMSKAYQIALDKVAQTANE